MTKLRLLACCFLCVLLAAVCWENSDAMLMGEATAEELLEAMETRSLISSTQHSAIVALIHQIEQKSGDEESMTVHAHLRPGTSVSALSNDLESPKNQLVVYLEKEVSDGRLSTETMDYLITVFDLVRGNQRIQPAPKSYNIGNGIVTYLGNWRDRRRIITRTDYIYNGVWGYAVGNREYALQGNWDGLHIIDVTDPTNPFRVQSIAMSGGEIWRDVATYYHPASDKTYAYVGAQFGEDADLWVVDLSYLSGGAPHEPIDDGLFAFLRGRSQQGPIPNDGYKRIRGYRNDGHTIHVVDDGYVFVNTARFGNGVEVLDVQADPWNPVFIAQWSEGDGHDVWYRSGVTVPGYDSPRDLLFTADGGVQSFGILDLTDLRSQVEASEGSPVEITKATHSLAQIAFDDRYSYAHSVAVSEDGQRLILFEENNVWDMAIVDIADPTNPQFISYFQWSGERRLVRNARVHNGQVRGSYLYVAYYEAGFRVFDIETDPTSPVEVGMFDTYRNPNNRRFPILRPPVGTYNGGWNVYVGLPSGNVLCSDTYNGLFIFGV